MIEIMKLKRALSKLDLNHSIVEKNDGKEALEILKQSEALPDIILLDLNLPKMNGIDFLKKLKEDERLRFIPTIILTTSSNQNDMLDCYSIGVSGYILKPLKYEDYVDKIDKLLKYWCMNELYV